jgi:hypothetical protein
MKRAATALPILLLLSAVGQAQGQVSASVHTAFFAESYSFQQGFPYERLTEFSFPVGLNFRFGQRTQLAISTGWANVDLKAQNSALQDQKLSGVIDTETRLTVDVVPGRLAFIAGGVIPTGMQTVAESEVPALGAIASDIIGLTTNELGNGGSVGMGFVGAVPIGRYALGYGATARTAFSYQPVSGDPSDLKPGNEARFRLGFEGPMGPRSYIRLAGIYALRQKDEFGGATHDGVGDRFVGYLSLNQGIGSSSLIVYGFDVYRSGPRLERTALGSQPLPEGNLVAAGLRWEIPVGRQAAFAPRGEFRRSDQALPERLYGPLHESGRSIRGGADFRYQASNQFAVVVQADGLTGFAVLQGTRYDVSGFKVGLHGEWRP